MCGRSLLGLRQLVVRTPLRSAPRSQCCERGWGAGQRVRFRNNVPRIIVEIEHDRIDALCAFRHRGERVIVACAPP